jgi:CRISPR-associated protein Cas1
MESVYVLEPGAYLRREGMTLKVVKGGKVIDQIPAEGLKRLMLVGYISLSGGVLDFLIKNRTETVFITPTGRFRARLAIDEHRHVSLRKAQYLRLSDDAFALDTAVDCAGQNRKHDPSGSAEVETLWRCRSEADCGQT